MSEYEARAGDEVAVASHRLHGARRIGAILEVMGTPGYEYYRVRWQDGSETVLHPGSDAELIPKSPRSRPAAVAAPRPVPEPQKAAQAPRPAQIRAHPGDRLVIKGHHLGEPSRDAEILEALGEQGSAPFRVRWADTGREGLLFPGPDALVDHIARPRRGKAAAKK